MPSKRIPIRSGHSPAGAEGPVFICTTCGKKTLQPGHLCAPAGEPGPHTCRYCGAITEDPNHVCELQQVETKYVCSTCGRVSPVQAALCEPREVAE